MNVPTDPNSAPTGRARPSQDREDPVAVDHGDRHRMIAGPWPFSSAPTLPLLPDGHADYPHQPGTLYDCPACEAMGTLGPD